MVVLHPAAPGSLDLEIVESEYFSKPRPGPKTLSTTLPSSLRYAAPMPSIRHFAAAVLAALLCSAPIATAADFYVDPALGVDDLGLADGSEMQPWRTLTFALGQVPDLDSHVLHLAAGEYSVASGETLPIRPTPNVSIEGDPAGGSVLVDTRPFSAPTIFWFVMTPEVLDSGNAIRNLTIERRVDGSRTGRGIAISARSTMASPELENLVITGAATGIDLLVDGDTDAAQAAPVITNCILTDNQIGLLATAYTYSGANSSVDPVLTNTVLSGNVDGAVFETTASYYLGPGGRRSATATPILDHATLVENIGSGLVLDDTNLGFGAAGAIRPAVLNSIFSAAIGDYAVNEFSNTSFPSPLENNLMEPSPLGFYLDDGLFALTTIAEVNALGGSNGNFEGIPLFVRDVGPSWRLRPDSPGVDAATVTPLDFDFEGDPRPTDSDGDGSAVSEVGVDEAPNCAVSAMLLPEAPEPRCGVFGPLDFDASASAMTEAFPDCSVPLEFQWYFDGEALAGETGPTLAATPERTGEWAVRVWCPDDPHCYDTASAEVIVHELPTADAGSGWSACIGADDDRVTVDLLATAEAPEGAAIDSWEWSTTSPYGAFLGGATEAPILEISGYTDFANLVVDVTVSVTDSNGCTAESTTQVNVWRAPRVTLDGPWTTCMSEGPQTFLPVSATIETPPGSSVAAYGWTTSVGSFDDASAANPSLIRNNLPFSISSLVGVTVTDDKGCSTTAEEVLATFNPSPTAEPGGPYQLLEDMDGVTNFALDGSGSRGGTGALRYQWTTDLGAFVPPSADAALVQLDVVNTGMNQIANVCLIVTDDNDCPHEVCTIASVRTGDLLPPNDVGGTFLVAKRSGTANLSWANAPIDATHDLADSYEVWETPNELPDLGGWTMRAGPIAQTPGRSEVDDAALLDTAGADLIFLKIVARNVEGASCVMNAPPRVTLDPDCLP